MATIYEVAQLAGVSIATVSHAYSGKRPVAEETIARIVEAAERIGYRPRPAARGLATGRSMTIGVVFPFSRAARESTESAYFFEFLDELSATAMARGYAVSMVRRLPDGDADHAALLASMQHLDGVIVVDPLGEDVLLDQLASNAMPVVVVGRTLQHPELPAVDSRIDDGMHQVFAHLREQGYRSPALMIPPWASTSYEIDMKSSFATRLDESGMAGQRVDLLSSDVGEVRRAVRSLLSGSTPPDAIIASTDFEAAIAVREVHAAGLRVPEDIGIIGAGDTLVARSVDPPLTSLRVFTEGQAETALALVLRSIEGLEATPTPPLGVQLVARESTMRGSEGADAAH